MFIGSAIFIFLFTPYERFAVVLNMIGCVFALINALHAIRHRKSNSFDGANRNDSHIS
jgi:hypothetical protein